MKESESKEITTEDGHHYFPIYINMQNKRCVVYGGGAVAARRVSALLRFGAQVTVYAIRIGADITELKKAYSKRLFLYEQPYEPGIPAADFVLSCVDDRETDKAIWQECRERGVPVNIASDQSMCDFFFPALVEEEDLVIGICSGGRDHRKVRLLAEKLRGWLGAGD